MNDAPHPALLPTGMHDLLPPEAEIEAQVVAQLMATSGRARLRAGQAAARRIRGDVVLGRRGGDGDRHLSHDGPGLAPNDRRARRHDATDRADRRDPARRRAAAVAAQLCRPGAAGHRLGDPARAAGRPSRRRADRRRRDRPPMSRRSRSPARRWPRSGCRICRSISPCRHWCRRSPRPMASPARARRRCAPRSTTRTRPRLPRWPGRPAGCLGSLLAAAGPAASALAALDRLDLPARARAERVRLGAVLDGLAAAAPGTQGDGRSGREPRLRVPYRDQLYVFRGVDPSGRSANSAAAAAIEAGDPAAPEPATGFTLYTDTILRTLPPRRRAAARVAAVRRRSRPRAASCARAAGSRSPPSTPAGDWRPRRAASAAAMFSNRACRSTAG